MKNVNLDLKSITKQLHRLVQKVQRYAVLIFLVGILGLYSFLVLQINIAAKAEPKSDQITQELNTVKRLKIDQQSIDKIQQLQDQNVNVQSLFESARDNPFQDE